MNNISRSHTRTLTALITQLLLSLILAACGAAPAGSVDVEAAVSAALQATEEARAPQATIEALQTAVAEQGGQAEQSADGESTPEPDTVQELPQIIDEVTAMPESVSTDLPDGVQPITVGFTVNSSTNEQTRWAFQAQQGDHVNITLTQEGDGQVPFVLSEANGENPLEVFDNLWGFIAPAEGAYTIELVEQPPTDTPYQLMVTPLETYALGDTVESTFDLPGAWLLQANPGDIVSITLLTDATSDNPFLWISDSFGNFIEYTDNQDDGRMELRHILPWSDGKYLIGLFGFDGDASFGLTFTDLVSSGPEIAIGETVTAHTDSNRWWEFSGEAGQEINISMSATSEDGLDPLLQLYDPWGEVTAQNDDGGEGYNSLISLKLPATGDYVLKATRAGSTEGDYSLTIQQGLAPGADIEQVNTVYVSESARFNIDDALNAYRQGVQQGIDYSVDTLNKLCWFGALAGEGGKVLDICDLTLAATEGSMHHGSVADSRGVARATAGDLAGAIEDLEFAVEGWESMGEPQYLIDKRQRWINALRRGENPFNEWALNSLRNQ